MTRKANGTKVRGRANGCGTLEKRKGVWLARWVVDGKRFTKSTGTGDRKEAEKVLAELTAPTKTRNELERLENMAARISGKQAEIKRFEDSKPALSVADAFEAFMRDPNVKARKATEGTTSRYEAEYGRFRRWLEEHYPEAVELRNVSGEVAGEFLSYLAGAVSANVYNKTLTLFKRVWRVLDGVARLEGANPWTKFENMTLDDSVRRELLPSELVRIGQTATGELALLFAIGIFTGLRLGDAVLLDWESVDLSKNHIAIIPAKTKRHAHGRPVHIPLVLPFRRMLLSVQPERRKGPLCPELAELYERDAAAVSKKIQRVFEECGIETQAEGGNTGRARVVVGFHSLRHSFVTLAAENNIPLAVVQAVVGHTSPAMTRHYLHVHEETLQANFRAFPDVFAADGEMVELPAPDDAVDVEAVTLPAGVSVELDAATAKAVDAIRLEGESRADAIRRAVETLVRKHTQKRDRK